MTRRLLFSEFPPTPTEEWEEQIRQDLGDVNYGRTLLWHLHDGFTVRPYYRSEDFTAHPEGHVELPSGWKIRQDIRTPDLDLAAKHARSAIEGGVDVLGIDLDVHGNRCYGIPLLGKREFDAFAAEVPLSETDIHFSGGLSSPVLLSMAMEALSGSTKQVSVGFDPIGEISRTGKRLDAAMDFAADMIRFADDQFAESHVIAADAHIFHNAGATPIQETALVLGSLSELIVQMIERGVAAATVLRHAHVSVPASSSYFLEIAKLRALRLVLRQLVDVFVPDERPPLPPIHAATSWRNQTFFDPHENMLRSTTEAAAAALGGCDVVAVDPFDAVGGRFDEFSYRMARNIQHILRSEAGFARVADPSAGSYYVEVLTDAIARRSWQLFQEIETKGGFIEALDDGFIHLKLEEARSDRKQAFAERRAVLVGTNHYPDTGERRAHSERGGVAIESGGEAVSCFEELEGRGIDALTFLGAGERIADPLPQHRIAEDIEERRLSTPEARVLLVPFGNPAIRSARASFAANFLGCGGFEIESPIAFDGVDQIVEAARAAQPQVIVFCAPDEEYANLVARVKDEIGEAGAGIVWGVVAKPDVLNTVDVAIHRASNLLETIDDLHRLLGITTSEGAAA